MRSWLLRRRLDSLESWHNSPLEGGVAAQAPGQPGWSQFASTKKSPECNIAIELDGA